MKNFKIGLSTGQIYNINANVDETLSMVLNRFLIQENINVKIEQILLRGGKINEYKKLSEIDIKEGELMAVKIERSTKIEKIKFTIAFSTGNQFYINENSNAIFKSVLDKLLKEKSINFKVKDAWIKGKAIDMNKTIIENNIEEGGVVKVDVDYFCFKLNINQILNKGKIFLVKYCKIPPNILDSRGDSIGNWKTGRKSGPPGFLKDYTAPIGWAGIGLKVINMYDNGDNTWLGTSNRNGEWYIAYHPIKTLDSISGIINNGFRRGTYQKYKNANNINPLNNNLYPICGEGVYFIPNFQEVQKYIEIIPISGYKFRIIFMCRINPYKVKIIKNKINTERWIVNGDQLNDIYGKKRDDEVRLYRILVYIE